MCLTSRRASYIAHLINISHIWLMATEWCFQYHQWFCREFSAMGIIKHSFHCDRKATSYKAFSFLFSSCIPKASWRWKTETWLGTHIPKGRKRWKQNDDYGRDREAPSHTESYTMSQKFPNGDNLLSQKHPSTSHITYLFYKLNHQGNLCQSRHRCIYNLQHSYLDLKGWLVFLLAPKSHADSTEPEVIKK